ncbi:uncharacterized protein UV8b_02931 [Ustilaginoidea virens]|uniref:Uncharacterized protein n=1 Tax=Ustilaginoidea virens TaxID=1159556 RepID=A0A1B5L4Q2_USTVR|nr:uncharacterized protein UV8b_02931 [Ustilaginoidea virens]QUC18690.1 hypothetical protein UV8b_02931 [Ustilaginoidea virens]GAO18109.1 hypothetical protein UVI_02020120 [Ustilaginoidea virens]
MLSTKSAQSLRNLFAGYHEPAGLSKQQSRKLLDGLKSSFRHQLDREYGRAPDRAASPAAVSEAHHQIRHSAATRHLRSILSNPLFSYDRQAKSASSSVLPATKRDPMDVFDHAVAKGMMTLKAATGCILAKRQVLSRSSNPPAIPASASASSDTALRVVRWLKFSGSEASLRFLEDRAFVRALTPLIVAEGLDDTAWEWLSRTVSEPNASWGDDLRVRRAAFLLAQLVHAKGQPQHGNLDAAITTILDAEQLYRSNPLLPQLLLLPWRSVSWLSTVESYSRAAPSERLFDAHVATAHLLPRALDVETAHLHLHHPTCPDHGPALRFFSDKEKLHRLVARGGPRDAKRKGMSVLPWIEFLARDTVNHLAQLGKTREADHVTALLRSELASCAVDSLSPT